MPQARIRVAGQRLVLLVGTVLCVTANAQDLIGCAASLHTLCPAPPIPLDGEPSPAPFGHLQLHVPGDHRGGPRVPTRIDFLDAYGGGVPFAPPNHLVGRYPWQIGSDNRLRVLSLWRTEVGSLSLQARHGREASLQWTIPLGTGTYRQGALDRWLGQVP